MERIKEALERARKERQEQGLGDVAAASAGAGAEAQAKPDSLKDIQYTQTRVIDISPDLLKDKRVVAMQQNDVVKDAYKMLRTQVLQRMRENGWNTLAITSPKAGEGKTLTAVNLAISLASEGNQTVLLVDLDLRRPGIHTLFSHQPEKGISDYLTDNTPLSEILFNPGIDRLVVVPAGEPIVDSSELLSTQKMTDLVAELKQRYPSRLVLFDLPPLLLTDDALAFLPNADAALMVLEEGKTQEEDLLHAIELLQGTAVLGTVLNKAEVARQSVY